MSNPHTEELLAAAKSCAEYLQKTLGITYAIRLHSAILAFESAEADDSINDMARRT